MSRPNYPNCVMTAGVIRGVKERQEAYDKDPEAYEERERRAEEQSERDHYEMEHQLNNPNDL